MRRNHPVNDPQYRGEQFKVHGEEAAQNVLSTTGWPPQAVQQAINHGYRYAVLERVSSRQRTPPPR
jgi:hypothetical protein